MQKNPSARSQAIRKCRSCPLAILTRVFECFLLEAALLQICAHDPSEAKQRVVQKSSNQAMAYNKQTLQAVQAMVSV